MEKVFKRVTKQTRTYRGGFATVEIQTGDLYLTYICDYSCGQFAHKSSFLTAFGMLHQIKGCKKNPANQTLGSLLQQFKILSLSFIMYEKDSEVEQG